MKFGRSHRRVKALRRRRENVIDGPRPRSAALIVGNQHSCYQEVRQPEGRIMTTPFRPSAADLARIGNDVAPISDIQKKLVANHPRLTVPDRVAHQYQIAGSKVLLRIADTLPPNFAGIGLFTPGAQWTGIGRISTGLGCPHLETDPDFLGLMV